MRIRVLLAGVTAAGLMAFPVLAQDGRYESQLTRILGDAANGTCLAELMAESLLTVCNGQIAGMSSALAALGAIETMTFVSATDTPEGRVETWTVKYASGRSLNWIIGNMQDGKFSVVGTAA